MVEVGDSGVQAQKFLSAFPPLKSLLLSSCGLVSLLNWVVAACRGDYLLVIDAIQAWDFPDRRSVASQPNRKAAPAASVKVPSDSLR